MAILKAYAAMIPRLEAEEALNEVTRIAIGTGSMKQEDSKRIMDKWRQQAFGAEVKPPAPRFNLAALSAAGIGVHGVKS